MKDSASSRQFEWLKSSSVQMKPGCSRTTGESMERHWTQRLKKKTLSISSRERMSSGMYLKFNRDLFTATFQVPSLQRKGERPFDEYLPTSRNEWNFWNYIFPWIGWIDYVSIIGAILFDLNSSMDIRDWRNWISYD